jgi:AbrB family looped-hinge helix DNA binding protein
MSVVQVSQKGQILIPKAIRERHGVVPGSRVQILEQSSGILIKPAPKDPISSRLPKTPLMPPADFSKEIFHLQMI